MGAPRRSALGWITANELLRRGRLLLAQVAKMPSPHESCRKNDESSPHDREPNYGRRVPQMIARRQQEHQHDVAQPAESDQRLNHEPVRSYTYYIYVLPTSHRSFSHLCPFGKWRQMPFPPHLYSEHSERQRARWISPPGPRFLLLASCFFALQAHFTTNSIL